MIKVKDVLNALAFIFTVFLVIYGFLKGYDLVEILVYNLYFIVAIITQIINLFERR